LCGQRFIESLSLSLSLGCLRDADVGFCLGGFEGLVLCAGRGRERKRKRQATVFSALVTDFFFFFFFSIPSSNRFEMAAFFEACRDNVVDSVKELIRSVSVEELNEYYEVRLGPTLVVSFAFGSLFFFFFV
jgi:hypothetical protein